MQERNVSNKNIPGHLGSPNECTLYRELWRWPLPVFGSMRAAQSQCRWRIGMVTRGLCTALWTKQSTVYDGIQIELVPNKGARTRIAQILRLGKWTVSKQQQLKQPHNSYSTRIRYSIAEKPTTNRLFWFPSTRHSLEFMRRINFISVTAKISEAKATQIISNNTVTAQNTHSPIQYYCLHFLRFESVDQDKTRSVVLQLKKAKENR